MVDIIQAVTSGNLQDVESELKNGVSANTKGQDGLYLTHYAAMANQPQVFDLLIKYQGAVNAKDHHNNTPLYYACRSGASQEFVQNILNAGGNINSQNKIGQTPSHVAVRIGNVDALKGLAKNGADFNVKDILGKTPLHDAIKTNHPESILLLIEFGASINIKDNYLQSPLNLAQASTNEVIHDTFSMPVISKLALPVNNTILTAVALNDVAAVKTALDSGASANATNSAGITGMHYATLHGNAELIKLLADNGGIINQTTYEGYQALHIAAMANQPKVVDTLLSLGAVVNCLDNKGNTPLHYAALQQHADEAIVKLLAVNANVNSQNNAGETPLHLAASVGNVDAVKLLVQSHANLTLKDNQGETALEEATKGQHGEIVKVLSQVPGASSGDSTEPLQLNDVLQMENTDVLSSHSNSAHHSTSTYMAQPNVLPEVHTTSVE